MKVVVTGGTGFLGQLLIRALCERGSLTDAGGRERELTQILAVDQTHAGRLFVDERVGYVRGDVGGAHLLEHVLLADTHAVFHLAAVVSAAAEADFELGLHVNVDGTRCLLDACRRQHAVARLVFASSVAVFGGALPAVVGDDTAPTPRSSYGVQKLIGELLVGEYTRKGHVDGRAIRLPTIVVRPGAPNAAASSFASSIIREPLAGRAAVCPVDAETCLWVTSPRAAVAALIHAHELSPTAWQAGGGRALNLPGLSVTVAQMLEALREVGGADAAARVRFEPDAGIESIVGGWPARFDTRRAQALGFTGEADFAAVVRAYAAAQATLPSSPR